MVFFLWIWTFNVNKVKAFNLMCGQVGSLMISARRNLLHPL